MVLMSGGMVALKSIICLSLGQSWSTSSIWILNCGVSNSSASSSTRNLMLLKSCSVKTKVKGHDLCWGSFYYSITTSHPAPPPTHTHTSHKRYQFKSPQAIQGSFPIYYSQSFSSLSNGPWVDLGYHRSRPLLCAGLSPGRTRRESRQPCIA